MATRTADIHIRIEPEIKSGAEKVFSEFGTTASDVIAGVYDYVYRHHRLPAKLMRKAPRTLNLDISSASEIKVALNESRLQARNGHVKTVESSREDFKRRHRLT